MSDLGDKRSDTTRDQILRAAAHQFAQRPYYAVGLDDILAEAQLTKGAMYFHFRSKHALALAIVDEQTETYSEAVQNLLARKLSGLETLIDFAYLIAVGDITQDVTRASFNLLESVGRTEKLQTRLLGGWIQLLGEIAERGIVEGDIVEQGDPEDIGRLLVLHPIRQATYGSRDQGRPPTGKPENRQLAFVKPQLLGQILKCREHNLVIGTYQRRLAHERPHT
jgi:TetR/AcrR family transcriptional regulator, transcriptional repressor for nem operon